MYKVLLVLVSSWCLSCGSDLFLGQRGPQGPTGLQGEPGIAGANGHDGADAPISPNNILSILDPCGDAPGIIDEVLLQLASGELLVFFANNVHSDYGRLAIIPPGNYITTDGQNCAFIVHVNGSVTW